MAATFEITSITPTQRADPGQGFVNVKRITFKTKPAGVVGTVDIPESAFTVEEVDKIVAAEAALLESVKNL